MKVPVEKPIRLGSGHCCACAGTCNHIGKIRLCPIHARHDAGSAQTVAVPPEVWDELFDVPRQM